MNTYDHKIIQESAWDEDANGKKWEDYETIVCPDGTVIDMVALIDDQYRAMAALNHLAPMLGGFVSKLRFVYTFRVATQATDGYNILVNPQFTSELDFTGKVFVMAHEVMHCMLNHMRRARQENVSNHDKWNEAADYEVNWTLVDIGLFKKATVIKNKALYDEEYARMGVESIFKKIRSSSKPPMNNAGQGKQAQSGSSNNQGQSNRGGQSGNSSGQFSKDYKAGWAQAIKDYQAGKIKI